MRAYQVIGLLLVCSGVAFVAGMKIQEERCADTIASTEECCDPLPEEMARRQEAPAIPTGSGLPCFLVFGTGTCESCQQVAEALEVLGPDLEGRIDVVKLDPDDHPAEAKKRRLRMIPTQILVDTEGQELARREGAMTAEEVVSWLGEAGIEMPADVGGGGSLDG